MSIDLDTATLLPYIKENKNWQYWFNFDYPFEKINVDQNIFSWNKNKYKIIKKDLKDSLQYLSNFDGLTNTTYIKFNKKNNQTEVIWRGQGEMTFLEKFLYYLPIHSSSSFETKVKSSLINLKNYLTIRYLKHDIVFGRVELFPGQEIMTFPFSSTADSLLINYYASQKQSDSILQTKSLKKLSKPFIIYYHSAFNELQSNFGYATSVEKDSIFYQSRTKLTFTKPFQAIKITLKGNYKFKKEVFKKLDKHLENIKYAHSSIGFVVEKPIKTFKDTSLENEWITDFYFPVKPTVEENLNAKKIGVLKKFNAKATTEAPQQREVIQPVEQIAIPVEKPAVNPRSEK